MGLAAFFAYWLLIATVPWWGQKMPNAVHCAELRLKGGDVYYLSPRLGWFATHGFWIFFGLFGICIAIMLFNWDKLDQSDKNRPTFLNLR
jgi:hypothetical protein